MEVAFLLGSQRRLLEDGALARRPCMQRGGEPGATCGQSLLGGGNSKCKALMGSVTGMFEGQRGCGWQNSKARPQESPVLLLLSQV